MGLPAGSLDWLMQQHAPMWAFVLALLTSPAQWSDRVVKAVRARTSSASRTSEKASE